MNVLLTRLALLSALLIACSIGAAPATAAVDGDLSYTELGTTIRIDGCSSSTCPAAITIPASLIGKPVTTLKDNAFHFQPALNSVTFEAPSNVTHIGTAAFLGSGLTSVHVPDSVTSMGDWAFAQTSALDDVTIGRGLGAIPQLAFYLSGIRSISFAAPTAVTTIGNQAFYGTANLQSITIPSSVSTIGTDAFWNASGLRTVTFAWPSSVTSLGFMTFRGAANLTTVDVFGNAPTVAAGAFTGTASSLRIRYLTATVGWTSSLDGIATALAPPWTPTTPTATGGDGSATVTAAVDYPSNAPTEITVTAAPGGRSCRIEGASGSCTVTGLTNGTAYTFTAVAANGTGASGASDPSSTVMPVAAPPLAATVTALRVSTPTTSARAVTTVVTVTGPGRIRQTATRLTSGRRTVTTICAAEKRTKRAGRVTITCLFDKAVRAELRRHPIRVRLTTRFTPTRGTTASSTATVTIPRSR